MGFSPWNGEWFLSLGQSGMPSWEGCGGIVWLAAWKLVSNDAKRTVAPPNAKHSTLPQGCFLCFCFWFHPRFRQQCRIYPQECSTEPQKCTNLLGWGNKKKGNRGWFPFFVVETKGFKPLTSAMWLQRSKPAGLRLYFRLAMQSNKKFGDLATYWRFFLSWSGIFSGFS